MSVTSIPLKANWNLATRLPAILLLGGAVNGFAVRVIEAWQLNGAGTIFFGISPFELIALAVALVLFFEAPENTRSGIGVPELIFLGLLLIPSSAAAWIATAFYGSFHALRSQNAERIASLLFIALAACSIWSSIIMKWIAIPVTNMEADIVWHAISFFRNDITLDGNIIGIPGSHQIILLIACTTLYGLPKAILGLMAISQYLGAPGIKSLGPAILITTALYAVANLIRLSAMVWSDAAFQLAHGPVGANIFDASVSALVLIVAFMAAERNGRYQS